MCTFYIPQVLLDEMELSYHLLTASWYYSSHSVRLKGSVQPNFEIKAYLPIVVSSNATSFAFVNPSIIRLRDFCHLHIPMNVNEILFVVHTAREKKSHLNKTMSTAMLTAM